MSIRRKIAIVRQWSFNFRSQSPKKDAHEILVAFPIQESALPPALAANLELKMGGNKFQPSQDFCRSKRVVSLFPFASIQRPLDFLRMKLIPLQAVNWSKALQSARLGRRVSHPVRSVDQTMLRKIMRLTRCEHSALQKRPITVHPACAARRRACLSATLLQL